MLRIFNYSVVAATLIATAGLTTEVAEPRAAIPEQPNVVVVMTDDQDVRTLEKIEGLPAFDSPCEAPAGTIMPCLQEHLRSRGVTFDAHTAAFPLCCPSRATYITGQYPHNHTVRANGEYGNLDKQRILPVWLQRAGYATAYAGKYQGPLFIPYGDPDHPDGRPPGWDRFWGLIDGGVGVSAYNYFNYVIDADGVPEPHGSADAEYQTDVLTGKAVGFIEEREATDDQPFFLSVGYVGPHWSNTPGGLDEPELPGLSEGDPAFESQQAAPVPAPRHLDELAAFRASGLKAPRTPAFNEADVSDKPEHIRSQDLLTDGEIARIDRWYTRRLASLLSVDEGINTIVETLRRTGELDDTVFIFTADNGWLEGAHRLAFQKMHPFEDSARVPLIVAGPGVASGEVVDEPTSNADIAPTIAALAGAAPDLAVDGIDLSPFFAKPARRQGRVILQETSTDEAGYVAVRTRRYRWVEHNTGERELYDLRADPFELESLHDDPALADVRSRLEQAAAQLRGCSGSGCVLTGHDLPTSSKRRGLRFSDRRGDSRGPLDIVAARAVPAGDGRVTYTARTAQRLRRSRVPLAVELRGDHKTKRLRLRRTGRHEAAVTTDVAPARWRIVAGRRSPWDRAPERFARAVG